SGLLVLGIGRGIVESTYHTFSVQGDLSRDADALSQKSILLSRVDVGPGVLDIYTTHLFNGGGLNGGPSPEQRIGIQKTQVDEIVNFIQNTHRKENVALLMGDFNIDARDTTLSYQSPPPLSIPLTSYQTLTELLRVVDLFDVWPFQFSQDVTPT